MIRKLLTHSGITLEYFKFGSGNKTVLCLPGFGRSAEEFAMFLNNTQCTYIAINHVYIGDSIVENDRLIEKKEFNDLLDRIIHEEAGEFETIDIIAYSLGGRLALCYLEQYPTRVNRMTLLAPDGLFINGWQKLTGKRIGRFFFKQIIIKRPRTFFGSVKVMRSLRFIPAHLPKFLKFHLDTPEKRLLVYKVWSTTARLIPDLDKVKQGHNCQFKLILGTYDKTIPLKAGQIFKKRVSSEVEMIEVESGHDLMKEEIFDLLQ